MTHFAVILPFSNMLTPQSDFFDKERTWESSIKAQLTSECPELHPII